MSVGANTKVAVVKGLLCDVTSGFMVFVVVHVGFESKERCMTQGREVVTRDLKKRTSFWFINTLHGSFSAG